MGKVDLNFNTPEVNDIFKKSGIVRETITAYYDDFFSESQAPNSFNVEVAYKEGERPSFLNDEFPSLSKARSYSVDKVLTNLVSSKIVQMF